MSRRRQLTPPASPVKVDGQMMRTPFLIGVAGGTASGKTSVCQRIMTELGQEDLDSRQRQVVMVSQDSFYHNLLPVDRQAADAGEYNFDHPGDSVNSPLRINLVSGLSTSLFIG